MGWTEQWEAWIARSTALRARADAVRWSRYARARKTLEAAGTGVGCAAYNALVDLQAGRPWREVDSSLLRKGLRTLESQFAAHEIVDRWADRTRPDPKHHTA